MQIAQGNYIYYLDGNPADVTESWSIQRDNDGRTFINSVRDASTFKSFIEVNAVNIEGHITSFEVMWENGNDGIASDVHVYYEISDNEVVVDRIIRGEKNIYHIDYAKKPVVSPLMRLFTGDVIVELSKHNTAVDVLVPNITDPANTKTLLLPLIEKRQAKFLHEDNLQLLGQSMSTRCYSYICEQYDENARFWLDEYNIMVRYTWQKWDVYLDEYVRS